MEYGADLCLLSVVRRLLLTVCGAQIPYVQCHASLRSAWVLDRQQSAVCC